MKTKEISVVVFKEVKGMCFMKCPVCNVDICIKDDEWCKCKHARDAVHSKRKIVYRIKKDNKQKHGFKTIIESEVKNYAKLYGIKEMEDELNGKSILLR